MGQTPVLLRKPKRFIWQTIREGLGQFLNWANLPGAITPLKYFDELTKTRIEVRNGRFFTVLSVNGRDFYFKRLSGEFDGTGMSLCSSRDADCR